MATAQAKAVLRVTEQVQVASGVLAIGDHKVGGAVTADEAAWVVEAGHGEMVVPVAQAEAGKAGA